MCSKSLEEFIDFVVDKDCIGFRFKQCNLFGEFQVKLRAPPLPLPPPPSLSMALRAYRAPIIASSREKTKKAVIRSSILQNRKQAAVQSVTSFSHNKVEVVPHTYQVIYEDKAMGITCYKDEKGEMICEGYDEGPRYNREEEEKQDRQRVLQVPRFLQAVKLQYLKDSEIYEVSERNGKDLKQLINSKFM